jgi:FAD/FMN-containing dehydrogenase
MATATTLPEDSERALRHGFKGQLILPGDVDYDRARCVFNRMIDRHPAVIARCADADDVSRAVDFALTAELPLAVRGGGHSVAGHSTCDDGIVIDLSMMKRVHIEPIARTAHAGAGLTLGELDRATQARGLATPLGIVSVTGIAGLTLGGGIGWLNGKHGLACDNVLSVEIVTADGRQLYAGPGEYEDLYWAVHGGGGNFGVVTSFEYRLHPISLVLGGVVIYPMDKARDVLRFYREFAARCPDELTTALLLVSSPDGDPVVVIPLCYTGPIEVGERILQPLREFGSPIADQIDTMEFADVQRMLDGAFPYGHQHYWKSSFLSHLSDEAIEILIESWKSRPSPLSGIALQHMHGAASRVDPSATAFAHRAEHFDCPALAQWADPADRDANIRWARAYWNAMRPHFDQGVYVNDLGDDEPDRVRSAYGSNYKRLAEVKTKYDPDNVFRLNQNIEPAPTPVG